MEDVRAGNPPPAEMEQRFGRKLFTQWRDISDASDDLIPCDDPADAAIDMAYFERAEPDTENVSGDTWYVVRCKLGDTIQGTETILEDGRKIIDSLAAPSEPLAAKAGGVTQMIRQFLTSADSGEGRDRLVLVLATELPLTRGTRHDLDDLRATGRARLGNVFDVQAVSIETIYLSHSEEPLAPVAPPIQIDLEATMANSGKDLMVGSIPLLKLYDFLRSYRAETGDLDQLYEKNVRRFLGGRGKVNKGMQATLNGDPAQFGLYNNGITIVVRDFTPVSHSTYRLAEPYIVNGCQTTRTLWEIFRQKLESGTKGPDPKLDSWISKAKDGVVIAKIVRVGNVGEHLLQNITRYTNSQNAVKDKDFITLDEGFHRWKREMATRYDIFLEVQRGGWDSQKALQKQKPQTHQFSESANAFDLLKVYGAGWLREAGRAFGSNKSFVPGGALYRQIVEPSDDPFGVDDLYAAFRIQKAADEYEFGRGSRKASRRQTRYLFYMVVLDLLRDVLLRANKPSSLSDMTRALLKLNDAEDKESVRGLLEAAVGVVDEYLTQGEEDSVFAELAFRERNSDLGGFLKWERLGEGECTPNLANLLAINKRTMGRGRPSPREMITVAIG
jgi:hypothetical protein